MMNRMWQCIIRTSNIFTCSEIFEYGLADIKYSKLHQYVTSEAENGLPFESEFFLLQRKNLAFGSSETKCTLVFRASASMSCKAV